MTSETRPRLQGARINAYELMNDGIPVTLVVDSAAGLLMARGSIDKVIVGADRITRDAVFNKIGTYSIAVLAKENGVPFYVAAPKSTFDLETISSDVTIEERSPLEVTEIAGERLAPKNVHVYNPAFDVTPIELVSGVINEDGVLTPDLVKKGNISPIAAYKERADPKGKGA